MRTIKIRIADPHNRAAHNSLLNALSGNAHIRDKATLKILDSPPDGMGPGLDVIQLVLGTGFDLAQIALLLVEWRARSRETATPIVVYADGKNTELSLDDLTEGGNAKNIIRRALAGAPDPRRSRCVLIGLEDYATLRPLPGVKNNLVQLRELLVDSRVWGIPSGRVQEISYPSGVDDIKNAISTAGGDAPDTLFVYFAGHGLYDEEQGLLLALPNPTESGDVKTVPWRQLAEAIRGAGSRRKVVWLDCCYAGLALPDEQSQPDSAALLEVAKVDGTYLLAAAQRYEAARASDGQGCTAFTGELVRVLRDGIAPGPPEQEFLSLNSLYQDVRSALSKKHLPEPRRHDPDGIGQHPHFNNNMTRQDSAPTGPSSPRDPWRPQAFRRRKVVVAGVGVLALVAALVVGYESWKSSAPPVSGLSLTSYCSALGSGRPETFTVAEQDCVQRINLDEACEFEYGRPGLRAKFTSPDPNSAVCYIPGTNETYNAGISDMTGYCRTLTKIPGVIATASNPAYRGAWICQLPINLDLACNSQNNRTDLEARRENGDWMCYIS